MHARTMSNLARDSLTIVATAALDGFVISDSTGNALGGGPLVGDFDALVPGKSYRMSPSAVARRSAR